LWNLEDERERVGDKYWEEVGEDETGDRERRSFGRAFQSAGA
jgi:hypothetical protein